MATRGLGFTASFIAWDVAANTEKTGDAANISLKRIADGTIGDIAGAVVEVDATNFPGVYKVAIADAECDCTNLRIGGKSSTSDVKIISQEYVMDPVYGSKVSITLEDGDSAGVAGIRCQLYDSDDNLVCAGYSGALGVLQFAIADGTYTAVWGPTASYSFSNPYTITVSGDTEATNTCAAISIPTPSSASLCAVYADMVSASGVATAAGEGKIEVVGTPGNVPAVDDDGNIVGYSASNYAVTDAAGRVSIELVRGVSYTLISTNGLSVNTIKNIEIPDAASYCISNLI